MTDFRCSRAAEQAGDTLAGSASTVTAFLLIEAEGPWGVDALHARLLPAPVRAHLANLEERQRIRPLLIRRQGRRREDSGGGSSVFVACADPRAPWLEHARLDRYEDLLELNLSGVAAGRRPGLDPHEDALFCVCTHGRHDTCCAERGRPVWEALARAEPEHSWQVSHIGGDRFAANVLVLPDGLYYGRLAAGDARRLVEAHRRGELLLDHLRGRSSYPFPVQAAELFLRREHRIPEQDRVRLLAHHRVGAETVAAFRCDGRTRRVRVRTVRGTPRQLTCRATATNPPLEQELIGID